MISVRRTLHDSTALTSVSLALLLLAAPATANPLDGQVVAGQATITTPDPSTLVVNQHSLNVVLEWGSFNIDPGETTTFVQPNADAWALNRIVGSQDPSVIAGTLNANGNIAIVNPDGIVFSQGSRVDVGGLVATTADIDNDAFMRGNLSFNLPGNPAASVINEGNISIRDHGLAAFVAPGVRNSGVITARLGTVSLASGNTFSLDLYGDGLVSLAIGDEITDEVIDVATGQPMADLVKNEGTISANGGTVALTAATARTAVNSVINNTGVIEVNSVGIRNGKIILGAQTATSRPITAPTQTVRVSGRLSTAAVSTSLRPAVRPGTIEITGEDIQVTGATIDASGTNGGGTVLIGGDYLGGRAISDLFPVGEEIREDYEVATAATVTVDNTTTITASATENGDGGKIILWSDDLTTTSADILATGSGDGTGGFIETSSAGILNVQDGYVSAGEGGNWLLDPSSVVIAAATGPTVTPLSGNSVVTDATINASLDAGTDVTVIADFQILQANSPEILKSTTGTANLNLLANSVILDEGSIAADASNGASLNLNINSQDANFAGPEVLLGDITIDLGGGDFDLEGELSFASGEQPTISNVSAFNYTFEGFGPLLLGGNEVAVVNSVLNGGGDVTLDAYEGNIFLQAAINKTSGADSRLRFNGGRLNIGSEVTSSEGKLDFQFQGAGETSIFTLDTVFQNGAQVSTDINTNGGDFDVFALQMNLVSNSISSDGSYISGTHDLTMPRIQTDGGNVTLSFDANSNTRTSNNLGGVGSTIGCRIADFCIGETNFVVDAGDGAITLASVSTGASVADMPLVELSDLALRTSGTLNINGVNVDERRATSSGGIQFDGPGNGVNAVEVGALNVISGDFDILDAQIGTTPPPPTDNPPTPTTGTISLPNAEQGTAYSETTIVLFSDDNGVSSLTLTVSGLPTGLTAIDNDDGTVTISGIPTTSGAVNITVTATDAGGNTATVNVALTVDQPAQPPTVDTPPSPITLGRLSLPNAEQGSVYSATSVVLFVDDNDVSALTLVASGLPAGLTATDNGNGTVTISGTPTSSGFVTFTVTATDVSGQTAIVRIGLIVDETVAPPPVDNPPTVVGGTPSLPNAETGISYMATTSMLFADDNGVAGLTLVVSGLPAGLSAVDNGDGTVTITGTPSVAGPVTFAVTATDAGGNSINTSGIFTVNEPTMTPEPPTTPDTGMENGTAGQAIDSVAESINASNAGFVGITQPPAHLDPIFLSAVDGMSQISKRIFTAKFPNFPWASANKIKVFEDVSLAQFIRERGALRQFSLSEKTYNQYVDKINSRVYTNSIYFNDDRINRLEEVSLDWRAIREDFDLGSLVEIKPVWRYAGDFVETGIGFSDAILAANGMDTEDLQYLGVTGSVTAGALLTEDVLSSGINILAGDNIPNLLNGLATGNKSEVAAATERVLGNVAALAEALEKTGLGSGSDPTRVAGLNSAANALSAIQNLREAAKGLQDVQALTAFDASQQFNELALSNLELQSIVWVDYTTRLSKLVSAVNNVVNLLPSTVNVPPQINGFRKALDTSLSSIAKGSRDELENHFQTQYQLAEEGNIRVRINAKILQAAGERIIEIDQE